MESLTHTHGGRQCNSGAWAERGCPWLSRVTGAVEQRAGRWRDLESVMGGQHVFSSAVGLQGFCGVDILRQLRFASHHRPLFPLVMLQLSDREGGS